MESVRFFVAGLPGDTTDKELQDIFHDYGEVIAVDLKTKKNIVDEKDVKIIAFVTLRIDLNDVQYCLNDLNWKKIRGAKINVSQAKESFLERLKRERQEAQATQNSEGKSATENGENESALLLGTTENKRKTFAEDQDLNDDDISPSLLITKKRAASSIRNGKIVIQSFDGLPVYTIDTKKKKRHLDDRSLSADQKRKNSLIKMKNAYQEKKSAIQAALAGSVNKANVSKISFANSDDKNEVTQIKKVKIFDSDDDENEEPSASLSLKSELFGKKGIKLAQMQQQQSLDPRFRIDGKFIDNEHADHVDSYKDGNSDFEEENERNWQISILEQVVGTKIDKSTNVGEKVLKTKKMLHFDPSKEEHQKFIRTESKENSITTNADDENMVKKQKKNKKNREQIDDDVDDGSDSYQTEREPTTVSKDVFYVVADTLAKSLKTDGANQGFSLLSMFSQDERLKNRNDHLQTLCNEKILLNKFESNKLNPFSHDSWSCSDGENENEIIKAVELAQPNEKQKKKLQVETFFIVKNDVRLKGWVQRPQLKKRRNFGEFGRNF